MQRVRDDDGSAVAEFTMVGALLTILTLAVIQLGLALLVRTTVLDAAAEGARYGALADNAAIDGVARTTELIRTAIGADYARDVTASTSSSAGHPMLTVTVRTTLPAIGLLGIGDGLEVSGHAAIEKLD